ncbi:hypothetical protein YASMINEVIRUS_979 [Yasminevirus sp. GU-2018]|uniref:Uncharacterized protein n=1 Tax=Yasminevirus sp. GU-2018 TaxID=2420051 RepID=A0A5K0UBM7_9VIRU|nr:hypothetical protein YASMINEVIRUS_979 [Yasminevirus sp. GU-2018]
MSLTDNVMFALYALLMMASLTFYGMWVSSGSAKDEIMEYICLVLIGLLFLSSIYIFFAYHDITRIADGIVVCYLLLSAIVAIKSIRDSQPEPEPSKTSKLSKTSTSGSVTGETVTSETVHEKSNLNRNLAIGLGVAVVVPITITTILDWMYPLKLPVNLE